jgi:NTE family protein
MAQLDANILRLAGKLATIQQVRLAAVVVPWPVAAAFRGLDSARALSEKVLRGDGPASDQLVARIGGRGTLPPIARSKGRALSPRATALLAQAQLGPVDGPVCLGDAYGNMTILQATFHLDAMHGYRDARLTTRAANYIQSQRGVLATFEARIDGWAAEGPGFVSDDAVAPGRAGVPPMGEGPPIGPFPTPLFPPGADVPEPNPVDAAPPDGGLCQELGDLCTQLFSDFAAAAMAEDDAQLLASVQPNCLCQGAFDDNTVFTARPDANHQLPPERGDYRLLFRGQDITDRIRGWSSKAIRFTIPVGSQTGYVWVTRYMNTVSAGLSTVLSNLCGLPVFGGRGVHLPPSPRALITIVLAPVIESFRINGQVVQDLVTEACRAVRLDWSVHLIDQTMGQPLPGCCSIQIMISEANGNVLHRSSDSIGSWEHNPMQNTSYHLSAESRAGKARCGEAGPVIINVEREHRLYVEPDNPASAQIVAGRTGSMRIRISCSAPDEGAVVRLDSSDVATLRVPDTALIFPGETSALVQFSTDSQSAGAVRITAQLAEHRDGALNYEVLQHLTAVVLSGGGAKGSFEVGALFLLREIWNEVRPRIVCGSSVGAINGLALAESTDGSGIDTLETIWLGLQYPSDMYLLSPEFQRVFDDLGINVPDLILHGGPLPFDSVTSLIGYLTSLGVSSETAAWVVGGFVLGGPVGALIGGAISIGSNDADNINQAVQEIGHASYAFDLSPTQRLIEQSVSSDRVANSGMRLRLAVVALEDGDLYYVTEAGHLLRGRAVNASSDETISNPDVLPPPPGLLVDPAPLVFPGFVRDPLVAGTMASAAFPGIFQIRPLFTQSTLQYFMDGGVRQVLPTQAAVELGAQLIFEVAASPMGAGTFERNHFGYPAALLAIVQRAISLQGAELELYIRAPRDGFCDQVERVPISPAFEVHDTIAIDPGLIRINMAYGYFRAFDADQFRRGSIDAIQYLLWQLWTDDLIGARLMAHQIEAGVKITSPAAGEVAGRVLNIQIPGTGLFDHGVLQRLRTLKNHVAELIVQRFDQFGVGAFPRRLPNAVMGDQAVLDWAERWELHPDPRRSFLQTIDLWAPQQLDYGQVSDDPSIPSTPGRREADVIGRFPIPDPVLNALHAR